MYLFTYKYILSLLNIFEWMCPFSPSQNTKIYTFLEIRHIKNVAILFNYIYFI